MRAAVLLVCCLFGALSDARLCYRKDVLQKGEADVPDDCVELHLRKEKLPPEYVNRLADGMSNHPALIRADLSWNQIPPPNAKYLFNALKKNSRLEGLAIELNELKEEGAEALAELLGTEESGLTQLYAGANQMMPNGIVAISKALARNNKLQVLDLGRNIIEELGAKALAEMLSTNKVLTTLYLPATDVNDAGLEAIIESLDGKNNVLTEIDLQYHEQLNEKLIDKVKKLTDKNRVALDSDL